MHICTNCSNEVERPAIISVFVAGKTDDGIQNTLEIGRLCTDCVFLLMTKQITFVKPEGVLSWQDFLT